MIDQIRQDIQERLEQLLAEADRLREALNALGDGGVQPSSRASGSRSSARSNSRSRASSTSSATRASSAGSRARSGGSRRARSASSGRGAAATNGRSAAGGTKNTVLKALADANGEALTASDIASSTGLGRASVSTTLSKLARAREVVKAQRGYRLSSPDGAPSAGTSEVGAEGARS